MGGILVNKKVRIVDLFDSTPPYLTELFEKCEFPWELLPLISEYIQNLSTNGICNYNEVQKGVLAGRNVKIYPNVVIEGCALIGEGSVLRPGSFLRGNVITGRNCVIGNSTEMKNCILLDNVQVPHYNYIGDSVLGNHAHMGAGAICSNLKSDGKNVVVHGEREYETGLRKLGGILGDRADVGCGCVINPGSVIGKNTRVYPMTSLRGVIGENCIVKSPENIVKIQ